MIPGRTVVDGRFELLEPLGSGGMGTVWRAYDLALHREVALKEVRAADPDRASSPGVQRERVLREARALARIGHPNVVAIHHIVDSPAEEHPWIVMELVRGRTLSEQIDMGPMPPAQAAFIGRGILAALRAAHAVGVLHRDIKPANVLLREDGSPVLTDFGIAAINGMEGLTSTGSVVGSLDYVAPERLGGQEGHPASDLWSLGLVLYVAVEGYHPMRRDTSVGTLAAVLRGEVPAPRRAGPLTAALQAILVPDPGHRPTAEQVDWLLAQALSAPSSPSTPFVPTAPPLSYGPAATSAPFAPTVTSAPFPQTGPSAQFPPTGPSAPFNHTAHVRSNEAPPTRQRRWIATGTAATAAIAVIVVVAVLLQPDKSTNQANPGQPPGTAAHPATSLPAIPGNASTTPAAAATTDVLTPAGVRQAISALEQLTGGQQFIETTFYPEFVNTGAPVKDRPTVYDQFTFRDGVATRTGAGGQLSGIPTVALSSIDWDILPTLLSTAQNKLGVANPTSRYIIVDPAWTFNDHKPTLLVYFSDEYNGGGYLAADVDGTVVSVHNSK
ncbi:MAG: protein kinase [Nocardia sp.]|uniref:serine/threonine-protein kinase n=1 Tax=Nocardia sp. TaxID=1821 RepID=UPI00260FAE65|nr:serine/threonine protein kinase [Nocardia sp.]MCU1643157.1 protein kinase [Nocardia sp.]